MQLSIGDAIAISTMRQKKFSEKEFKKFHPSGSIGAKLKTVGDLMLKDKKIPFINENKNMRTALKIITKKKLVVLIVQSNYKRTNGKINDGQIFGMLGPNGVGKSTLSMEVANFLGIKRVVSTDSVREVLRSKIDSLESPELHRSTFSVGRHKHPIYDWEECSNILSESINSVIDKSRREGVDLILEGAVSPSGYTEPILHKRRLELKSMLG